MSSDDLINALSFRVDPTDGTGDLGDLMEWTGGCMIWSGDLAGRSGGDLVSSTGNPVDWSRDLTCWTGTSMALLIVRYNANAL